MDGFDCAIGYSLPHENPDAAVWVGITLCSYPGGAVRKEIIDAFRGWLENSGRSWSAWELDDEWCGIRKGTPLQSLMGGDDHVQAVKDYLKQLLREVEEFKKAYPNLPWLRKATQAPASPS